jgi:hypothetical protein
MRAQRGYQKVAVNQLNAGETLLFDNALDIPDDITWT